MKVRKTIDEIRALIGRNELEAAMTRMMELLGRYARDRDEVILQSARYREIAEYDRTGRIEFEKASVTRNQIRIALLGMLTEIEAREAGRLPLPGWLRAWCRRLVARRGGWIVLVVLALSIAGGVIGVGRVLFFQSVEGRVIDEQRRPVAGARVVLQSPRRERLTDARGEFVFRMAFFREGPYVIRIEKPGFLPQLDTIRQENQMLNHKIVRHEE